MLNESFIAIHQQEESSEMIYNFLDLKKEDLSWLPFINLTNSVLEVIVMGGLKKK